MQNSAIVVSTETLLITIVILAGLALVFLVMWLKTSRLNTVISTDRAIASRKHEGELQSRDLHYEGKIQTLQAGFATELAEKDQEIAVLQERLAAEASSAELKLDAAYKSANDKILAERRAADERVEAEQKRAEEKLHVLNDAKNVMSKEFQALADATLKSNTEHARKQHKAELDILLEPLQKRLGEFQERLNKSHQEAETQRAVLGQQIQELKTSSTRMSAEAENLTRALKGESQIQGAWGEMVLSSILEKSGLRDGEEYQTQQSYQGEENQRLRPDVVVDLPGSADKIIIDAKVSLKAFEEYVQIDESDTDAREAALKRHMTSIRTHITTLAGKEYQSAVGSSLDYVILFIPIEGALSVALKADPGLTAFAADKNIAITTPTTLMVALRTIASVWRIEYQNRNALEIARQAGTLYDKFHGFVEDLNKIGTQLDRAQGTYGDAVKKLKTGNGNLINRAEKLKLLGAKANKQLERDMVDIARESDAVSAPISRISRNRDDLLT